MPVRGLHIRRGHRASALPPPWKEALVEILAGKLRDYGNPHGFAPMIALAAHFTSIAHGAARTTRHHSRPWVSEKFFDLVSLFARTTSAW